MIKSISPIKPGIPEILTCLEREHGETAKLAIYMKKYTDING